MKTLKVKTQLLALVLGVFSTLFFASCETCEDPPDCVNGSLAGCKCVCDDCWTGTLCENSVSACIPCTPDCGTHGNCDTSTGTCDCDTNYSGPTCDIFTDPCPNTICVNGTENYTNCSCNCSQGWTGADCSEQIPTATSFQPDPILDICPTHIGGDREFAGNGPAVTIRCEVYVLNGKDIYADPYFHARETISSNATEALYQNSPILIYSAPSGKKINQILSDTYSQAYYVDTDLLFDIPTITGGNLVSQFRSMGDTGGNDLGPCISDSDAELNIYFNVIEVELIDQ